MYNIENKQLANEIKELSSDQTQSRNILNTQISTNSSQ